MCEERVIRSEKLALKYQQQFETSQAQGVKWKKDRQDIGNYALTLEKALKKAHNDIESLKRTRTTNVQHGMQPIGDNSMNTTKFLSKPVLVLYTNTLSNMTTTMALSIRSHPRQKQRLSPTARKTLLLTHRPPRRLHHHLMTIRNCTEPLHLQRQ